jgi:flagellar protein FlgJ
MEILMTGNNLIDSYTGDAVRAAARAQDDSFAKRLEEAAQKNDDKELKRACQEFEAIVLNILYKQMKATVIKSGLIKEDPGTGIFESMYDEQLMEQASKTGSFGLAESLYRQLSGQYGMASRLK